MHIHGKSHYLHEVFRVMLFFPHHFFQAFLQFWANVKLCPFRWNHWGSGDLVIIGEFSPKLGNPPLVTLARPLWEWSPQRIFGTGFVWPYHTHPSRVFFLFGRGHVIANSKTCFEAKQKNKILPNDKQRIHTRSSTVRPWKMMAGRSLSYWDGIFSGAILNFRLVSS